MADLTDLPPGFGDPATLQRVGDTAQQTAQSLAQLNALVNKDVTATVPDQWGGESASWFEQKWFSISKSLDGMGSPMEAYRQQLDGAAQVMQQAREQLTDANQFITQNGLYITPDLRVEAIDNRRPDAQAVAAVGQNKLDLARKTAGLAQQRVRDANTMLDRMAVQTERQVAAILGAVAGAGGGRRTPRERVTRPRTTTEEAPRTTTEAPRTAKEKAWEAYEKEQAAQARKLEQQYTMQYERGPAYRNGLTQTYEMPRDGQVYVAHHNFPVKNSADFAKVGIDTTNPVWGSWVEAGTHQQFSPAYERSWDTFFQTNRAPTRNQVLDFGRNLANQYGYPVGF